MRFGFHLSVAGGLWRAAREAAQMGLGCLQVFLSNPRGWAMRELRRGEREQFRSWVERGRLRPVVAHAPYLLNLASNDPQLWQRSVEALKAQLVRARALGIEAVVVHPGSASEGLGAGLRRVGRAVAMALVQTGNQVGVWVENTAGGGGRVGGRLWELGELMGMLEGLNAGVCLDTAHGWAAGYELGRPGGVERWIEEIERWVGLKRVKLWHFNDITTPLGSHRDIHAHLGTGHIGYQGLRALVAHPALAGAAVIMETPKDSPGADRRNLEFITALARAYAISSRALR